MIRSALKMLRIPVQIMRGRNKGMWKGKSTLMSDLIGQKLFSYVRFWLTG